MAVRTVLKQPEKNAQRDPGEKGWVCYYCEREGHLKRGCPQASKLTPVPYPVRKGPHWRRDCPHRCKFQGSDSQDNQTEGARGVPTQAPILITPEEPWVVINVGGHATGTLSTGGCDRHVKCGQEELHHVQGRGRSQEDPMPEGQWPRGVTPHPR